MQGISVVWVLTWQTWSPHSLAITFFKNFCFFYGIENPLTCCRVSTLPLPLHESLILPSMKEKSADLMASSLLGAKIFRIKKSGLSSSTGDDFNLYNSIYT